MTLLRGCKALIRDSAGRILLLEDSTVRHGVSFSFWDLPGGKPEDGETPEQTVRREVREETGLDVIVKDIVGSYTIVIRKGVVVCDVYESLPSAYTVNIHANPAKDEMLIGYDWLFPADAVKRKMSRSLRELLTAVAGGTPYG